MEWYCGERGFHEVEELVFVLVKLDFDEQITFVQGVLFPDDLDIGVGFKQWVEVDFFDVSFYIA